jgi:hypothetical protein
MGASIQMISVFACALLTGCVQVGLANGPVLGGGTPETRVHDVIANSHDACERTPFPLGEVLRGQVPPCSENETVASVPAFMPRSKSTTPSHPRRVCPSAGPGLVPTESGLVAVSLPSPGGLTCSQL